MPVRSLNSSVLKWPDRRKVDEEARSWGARTGRDRPGVVRIGYMGSYARGDWGVGSDLDLVLVVRQSSEPFHRRGLAFGLDSLPVPADLLVYTEEEFERLLEADTRFAETLKRETVWVYDAGGST